MRFTVITYGSEGDTRPYVALCRGLIDAGHETVLFVEPSTMESARLHRVPVCALTGDLKSTLPLTDPNRELHGRDMLRTLRDSFRVIRQSTQSWMRQVGECAKSSDAILYGGLAAVMAEVLAHELDKPAINLFLQPTSTTGEFPASTMRHHHWPRWLNRLSYQASPRAVIRRFYGKATRAARRKVFGSGGRLPSVNHPILYGFSRHLVPRPADWPETDVICGHWPLPPLDWSPPRELREFLAAGPPPIYVGFGSVSSLIRRQGLATLASALAGRRVLFYPGWSNISADLLPANFLVIADTPHAWLFPRTSMVIHHCGAGTTHTATRAGVPSVALPFGADQFFWADRLNAAGVAARYIAGNKLHLGALSESIAFASQDAVRRRAQEIGAAMAEENGVAAAVAAIEAQLRHVA